MKSFLINENKSREFEEKYLVLIIYDISDNRRRYHFSKFISSYASRVQKSCFESYLSDRTFKRVIEAIPKYIEESQDNVRVYQLSVHGKVYNYGIENENSLEENIII